MIVPLLTFSPQPCRRCKREGKECVLGESHRGGRRVRKKPKLDHEDSRPDDALGLGFETSIQTPTTPSNPIYPSSGGVNTSYSPISNQHAPQLPHTMHDQYGGRQDATTYGWHQQPTPTDTTRSDSTGASRSATEQVNVSCSYFRSS